MASAEVPTTSPASRQSPDDLAAAGEMVVLARIPRVNSPVPAVSQSPQWRVDPPVHAAASHVHLSDAQQAEAGSPSTGPQPDEVKSAAARPKSSVRPKSLRVKSMRSQMSPLRTIRKWERTASEGQLSAVLLQAQAMLRPLARVIVLVALLAAAVLAYLLLEEGPVPLEPAPATNSIPLVRHLPKLTSAAAPSEASGGDSLALQAEAQPSAVGPAGSYQPSAIVLPPRDDGKQTEQLTGRKESPQFTTDLSVVADAATSAADDHLPASPAPEPQLTPSSIAKDPSPGSDSASGFDSATGYPDTGYPDTGQPAQSILPIAGSAIQSRTTGEAPPAVARLTGSVKPSPEIR